MNAPDPGMAYLNSLLDDLFLIQLRKGARRYYRDDEDDIDLALEAQSSASDGHAQAAYEKEVITEARAIVDGISKAAPTVEHLRVLIDQLPRPGMPNGSPF